MKKTVLILMLGVLLIASNLFAADGDLIVEGKVGIGTDNPTTPIEIYPVNSWDVGVLNFGKFSANPTSGTDDGQGATGFSTFSSVGTAANSRGASGASFVVSDPSSNDVGITGGSFWMLMSGPNGINSTMTKTADQYGQRNILESRGTTTGSTGTFTYTGKVAASQGSFYRGATIRNFIYNNVYGYNIAWGDNTQSQYSGNVAYTNFYGLNIEAFPSPTAGGGDFLITNYYGISLPEQPSTNITNRTNLLIGTGAAGNWSIYNNSLYKNYFAGALGIGTTNPGTDKLKVAGTVSVNSGTNIVYRCTTAGALPVGALTINTGNCGARADTGLRVN